MTLIDSTALGMPTSHLSFVLGREWYAKVSLVLLSSLLVVAGIPKPYQDFLTHIPKGGRGGGGGGTGSVGRSRPGSISMTITDSPNG